MKILLTASGSRGDIQPMIALGLGLKQAGHQISLCAQPTYTDWAAELDIPFYPMGRDILSMAETLGETLIGNPLRGITGFIHLLKEEIQLQYEQMMPIAKDFDMIIAGSVQFAAFSAAEKYKIPYQYIVYCPLLMPSFHHPPMSLPWPTAPRWINRLAWIFEMGLWNMGLIKTVNQCRKKEGLLPIKELLSHIFSPLPLVAAHSEYAPLSPELHYPALQVGAFHLQTPNASLPEALSTFLEAGEPPIYIGFGSMYDGKAAEITALIQHVALQSQRRFILSKGWGGLGGAQLPDNVFLIDAVPHDLLFPKMATIVHHGGAGTTAQAALAGIPQVIIPHLMDQYYWGHQIYSNGLGPAPIPRKRLTAAKLLFGIQEIHQNFHYADRARSMGEILRQKDGIGDAIHLILGSGSKKMVDQSRL